MPPLLEVRDLHVTFPVGGGWRPRQLHALQAIDLQLDRGQILAVVGESGSGKSTLGRAIARLQAPTSGQILVDGRPVSDVERRRVQMVFQDPFASLNPAHTIGHHVVRPLALHGLPVERAGEWLEWVGLGREFLAKRPFELSGGQRQRVAIARALAPEPDLLVADEPTSMLDVSIRMDVLRLFDRLRRERGVAVLLITHDLAAARAIADRVLVLYAGRVMEEAPARTLARDARHPYTRLLLAAAPRPGGSLEGELPARPGLPPTVDPPPGCPFAARCLDAVEACGRELPRAGAVRCHVHG